MLSQACLHLQASQCLRRLYLKIIQSCGGKGPDLFHLTLCSRDVGAYVTLRAAFPQCRGMGVHMAVFPLPGSHSVDMKLSERVRPLAV